MNNKRLTTAFSGAIALLVIFGFAVFIWKYSAPVSASATKRDKSGSSFAPEAVFPGTGVGAIPDSGACGPTPGAPLNISFLVSGFSGPPSGVSLSMTFGSPNHTWMGDIIATLRAPNGTSHVVFGQTGSTTATGAGDSSDLGATYLFSDSAAAPPSGGWWQESTARSSTDIMTAGTYRTTAQGGAGQVNPAPATNMNAAFGGIPTSNGTWVLSITDGCSGDTGAVTAASLTLTSSTLAIPPNDLNADGKSDFTIVRADGGPAFSQLRGVNDFSGKDKVANMEKLAEMSNVDAPEATGVGWYSASSTGVYLGRQAHGVDTDFFYMANMVGDSKKDLVVWSPGAGATAMFKILDSGTFTVTTRQFGSTGDLPDIGGDFNGDGKDDLVVYRDGTAGSPQSYFYWASVTDPAGSFNTIPWGIDGDVAFTLDYDGDGKADPAVQRNGGGGRGDIYILRSSNGSFTGFSWGFSSDFVVPGDYDGDGKDDICVSRNANFGTGTFKYFFIRPTSGAAPIYLQWGIPGDFIVQGDYDADGKTDIGVWRASATPGMSSFFINKSAGGFQYFLWGQSGDYPVNNWNVH